jgi:hypothetical protein
VTAARCHSNDAAAALPTVSARPLQQRSTDPSRRTPSAGSAAAEQLAAPTHAADLSGAAVVHGRRAPRCAMVTSDGGAARAALGRAAGRHHVVHHRGERAKWTGAWRARESGPCGRCASYLCQKRSGFRLPII